MDPIPNTFDATFGTYENATRAKRAHTGQRSNISSPGKILAISSQQHTTTFVVA